MPNVVCPRCGNTVFAAPAGSSVVIRGGFDATTCPPLRPYVEAGADISDALECPEMEAAVEQMLGQLEFESST